MADFLMSFKHGYQIGYLMLTAGWRNCTPRAKAWCGSVGRVIPAIVISADQTEALREEAMRRGHAFLAKPVKPAALRALMTRLLVQRAALVERNVS